MSDLPVTFAPPSLPSQVEGPSPAAAQAETSGKNGINPSNVEVNAAKNESTQKAGSFSKSLQREVSKAKESTAAISEHQIQTQTQTEAGKVESNPITLLPISGNMLPLTQLLMPSQAVVLDSNQLIMANAPGPPQGASLPARVFLGVESPTGESSKLVQYMNSLALNDAEVNTRELASQLFEGPRATNLKAFSTVPESQATLVNNIQGHSAAATNGHSPLANPVGLNPTSLPGQLLVIETPVQQPGWQQAMSQRVVWAAQNNLQFAQLSLNPPELGPVDVRISVDSDRATVWFSSSHGTVREALESALPRLRESFEAQGLELVEGGISDRPFGHDDQGRHKNEIKANGLGVDSSHAEDEELTTTVIPLTATHQGLVDYFV